MTHNMAEIEHGMDRGIEQPMQPQQGTAQQPWQFEDTLTRDMRVALHDFVETATVCNWCANECLGVNEECARICRDVADLAALNAQFLARDSVFGVDVAETFAYAAEECEEVCSQFSEPHCQECASVLRRAIDSTWAMLDSFQHVPQQSQQPMSREQYQQPQEQNQQPQEQYQQPMAEDQRY